MHGRGCADERGDRWSRRRLLEVGGLSVAGLGLPQLLAASPGPRPAADRPERSCIFIVQYGGASHIDSWDLKPDAPADIRGPYKPAPCPVPELRVCELMPRLARMADRYCVVRSMTHGNPGHDGGMHVCMTGHSNPTVETPYFGSALARVHPSTRNVPSYVWVQNLAGDVQPRYLNGGFLGAAYAPVRVGNDLDNPATPGFRVRAFDPPEQVSPARLAARRQLLANVDGGGNTLLQQPSPGAFRGVQERAFDLVTGAQTREAFDLAKEPDRVRDRYGRHPLGQNLLMARRLVEAGVRLVTVVAWTGVPPGEQFRNVQTWDMHGDGPGLGSIFGTGHFGLGWALPRVDEAVSALLEDLTQRGLLDNTLVAMVGEFGRAPRIAQAGRDHWPACYSAMLAGSGIRGGLVYGSSDKTGGYVDEKPVTPEAFGATLFHALGVSPETRLGLDGFTSPLSAGQPVLDLFN